MKPEALQGKIVQEVIESIEKTIRDHVAWSFAAGYKSGSVLRGPLKKNVIQMTKEGFVIKEWDSLSEAGRALGIHESSIIKCCKGRLRTSGKFKWKYSYV